MAKSLPGIMIDCLTCGRRHPVSRHIGVFYNMLVICACGQYIRLDWAMAGGVEATYLDRTDVDREAKEHWDDYQN